MQSARLKAYFNTLAPGEVPATCARQLSQPQRAALVACATAGRLHRFLGDWHADNHAKLIHRITVETLRKRGLVTIAGRNARLTNNGKWYARTLCSDLAGVSFSTEQGVAPCLTEN
jgi:hypothetical protein